MPKLNKPRTGNMPDPETARAFLAEHQIALGEVTKVSHCADGSMYIVTQRGDAEWGECIEFDPDYTSQIALAFRAVGVPVDRGDA
jgi:hypothetical protein